MTPEHPTNCKKSGSMRTFRHNALRDSYIEKVHCKFGLRVVSKCGKSGTEDNKEPDLVFEKKQDNHDRYCIDFTWSNDPEKAYKDKVKKYKDVFGDQVQNGEDRIIPVVVDHFGRIHKKSEELVIRHLELDKKFVEKTALYETIHWLVLATKSNSKQYIEAVMKGQADRVYHDNMQPKKNDEQAKANNLIER